MKSMKIAMVTMILVVGGLVASRASAFDQTLVQPAVAFVGPGGEALSAADIQLVHDYRYRPRRHYYRHHPYRPYHRPYYRPYYYRPYARPYYYGYPYGYYGSPLGFSLSLPFLQFHLGP